METNNMKIDPLKKLSALLVTLLLSACVTSADISNRFAEFNQGVGLAHNEMLLRNIARAYYREPMLLTSISANTEGMSRTYTSGGLTLPFGGNPENNFGLSPQATQASGPSISMSVLNTQKFYQGFISPPPLSTIQHFWKQGWNKEMLLFMLLSEITVNSIFFDSSADRPVVTVCEIDGVDGDKNGTAIFPNYPADSRGFLRFQRAVRRLVWESNLDIVDSKVSGSAYGPALELSSNPEHVFEALIQARKESIEIQKVGSSFQINTQDEVVPSFQVSPTPWDSSNYKTPDNVNEVCTSYDIKLGSRVKDQVRASTVAYEKYFASCLDGNEQHAARLVATGKLWIPRNSAVELKAKLRNNNCANTQMLKKSQFEFTSELVDEKLGVEELLSHFRNPGMIGIVNEDIEGSKKDLSKPAQPAIVQFKLRSIQAILYYLGELVRAQELAGSSNSQFEFASPKICKVLQNQDSCNILAQDDEAWGIKKDSFPDLFKVEVSDLKGPIKLKEPADCRGKCAIATAYGDKQFKINRIDYTENPLGARTMQVLSFFHQLLALNQSRDDLPTTPTVNVVNSR
ncbi:MAG: hypothetical protein AAF542_07880 [Pseudomonadota bacterium]